MLKHRIFHESVCVIRRHSVDQLYEIELVIISVRKISNQLVIIFSILFLIIAILIIQKYVFHDFLQRSLPNKSPLDLLSNELLINRDKNIAMPIIDYSMEI